MIENVKCVKSCDVFVREDGGQMCQLFAGFFFVGVMFTFGQQRRCVASEY